VATAKPALGRLLGNDVGRLLEEMAVAVPGLSLAVIDLVGEVAASSGNWPDGVPDGAHSLAVVPRDERIGSLVWQGDAPGPLLDGLRRSIEMLLAERLEKQELARETLERYREINLLYRASETIGASLDATEVPRMLLAETERVIPSDAGTVLIGAAIADDTWQPAAGLIADVRRTGRPDIASWPVDTDDGLQSALCVPVRAGERVLGVVVLGRTAGRRLFTAGDEKLLLGLASQAGVALERARLHEQETVRLRMEEELAVARRIQLALLPAHPPVVPGWSFAATYQAARQVGGDFYDFLDHAVDRRRIGLVIADVTGKGVPAALMMAYSRAVVRAESMAGRAPLDVLANANRVIVQERQTRLFLSAFYGELDLDTGRLTYANAGHDAPLWIDAGGRASRELDGHGVILGAFNDIGLESHEILIQPRDTVILYTDGVTEARDHERELFGDERLVSAACAAVASSGSAQEVLESVVGAVADFTAGAEQADDLTVVVVQRAGG
jgi:serine phosphatase RsbU (regulator of sigma subunit)